MAVRRTARPHQAQKAYERGLHLYEELVAASPQIPRYQGYLGLTLDALAVLWRQRGDLQRAREYSERAVRHQRTALTSSPGSFTYGIALQNHYRHLGETLLLMGDHERAARAAHELANVISRCPFGGSDAMDMLARSATLVQSDARLPQRDKEIRIERYLKEAVMLAQNAAQNCGDGLPRVKNNIAWFLASCPDPRHRKPAEAVRLARAAVEVEGNIFCYWNTLGLAHYRNGEYKNAIRALKKSIDLNRRRGDSLDWFILAMAQWQAGDKEQAQKSFDQAVRQQSASSDVELSRFRAEAARLLERPYDAKPKESVAAPRMIPAGAAECIDCPRKAQDIGWTRGGGLERWVATARAS